MLRSGQIELPLNAFMQNFSDKIERVPFFNAFEELFHCTDEVRTIVWPNDSKRSHA